MCFFCACSLSTTEIIPQLKENPPNLSVQVRGASRYDVSSCNVSVCVTDFSGACIKPAAVCDGVATLRIWSEAQRVDPRSVHQEPEMHQGRLRLRPWLEEQIDTGRYPGVVWLDQVRSVANAAASSRLDLDSAFNRLQVKAVPNVTVLSRWGIFVAIAKIGPNYPLFLYAKNQ